MPGYCAFLRRSDPAYSTQHSGPYRQPHEHAETGKSEEELDRYSPIFNYPAVSVSGSAAFPGWFEDERNTYRYSLHRLP